MFTFVAGLYIRALHANSCRKTFYAGDVEDLVLKQSRDTRSLLKPGSHGHCEFHVELALVHGWQEFRSKILKGLDTPAKKCDGHQDDREPRRKCTSQCGFVGGIDESVCAVETVEAHA